MASSYPRELHRMRQPVVAVCSRSEMLRDSIISSLSIVEASVVSQKHDSGHDPQGVTRYLPGDMTYSLCKRKRRTSESDEAMLTESEGESEGESLPPPLGLEQSASASPPASAPQPAPRGILKANWMGKHQDEVPSTVVLALDYDVDVPPTKWVQVEAELCTVVSNIRRQLNGRVETRLMAVFVQERDYPHVMEVPDKADRAKERIRSFCRACDFDLANVTIIHSGDLGSVAPGNGIGMGTLAELHKHIHELANAYYKDEIKRIKANKKRLDRTQPGGCALYIRYSFKIAQHCEARNIVAKAVAFYLNAYDGLLDMVRMLAEFGAGSGHHFPYDLHEIKTVAEYIHFRLCSLYLLNREWDDCVIQFTRHMRYFANLLGPDSLVFQHWDWVSRQYDIFSQIVQGYRPSRSPRASANDTIKRIRRDSSYYMGLAARFAVKRREASQKNGAYGGGKSCSVDQAGREKATQELEAAHGIKIEASRYVGGSPTVHYLNNPLEQPKEINNIEYTSLVDHAKTLFLFKMEGLVDQSAVALTLWKQCLNHLGLLSKRSEHLFLDGAAQPGSKDKNRLIYQTERRGRPGRRKARITYCCAVEYMEMGNYSRALPMLLDVAEAYCAGKWDDLVGPILSQLYRCCCGLDITSIDDDQLKKTLYFVLLLLSNPNTEDEPLDVHNKLMKWAQNATSPASLSHCFPVAKPSPLTWTCRFESDSAVVGESVVLRLAVQSRFPAACRLKGIDFQFNNPKYNVLVASPGMETAFAEATSRIHVHTDTLTISPQGECTFDVTLPILELDDRFLNRPAAGRQSKMAVKRHKKAKNFVLDCRDVVFHLATSDTDAALQLQVANRVSRQIAEDASSGSDATTPFSRDRLTVLAAQTGAIVELDCVSPALVGERFPIRVTVKSEHEVLHSPCLSVECWPPTKSHSMPFFFVESDGEWRPIELDEHLQPSKKQPLSQDPVQENQSVSFEYQCVFNSLPFPTNSKKDQVREVVVKLWYSNRSQHHSRVESRLEIPCALPFRATFSMTPENAPLVKLPPVEDKSVVYLANQPICVDFSLECSAMLGDEQSLEVLDIDVDTNDPVELLESGFSRGVPATIGPLEVFSTSFRVVPRRASADLTMLGRARVKWRRVGVHGKSGTREVEMFIALPSLMVQSTPLSLSVSASPLPWVEVGRVFEMTAWLTNRTSKMQRCWVEIKDQGQTGGGQAAASGRPQDDNASGRVVERQFLIAGAQKREMGLLPNQSRKMQWRVVALSTGHHVLPQVVVNSEVLGVVLVAPYFGSEMVFVRPSQRLKENQKEQVMRMRSFGV